MTRKPIEKKKATAEEKRTLAALGYTPDQVRWTWSSEQAQERIAERCNYLGIAAPGDAPLHLTAWQTAEVMLDYKGYEVHELPQPLCYTVTGGREVYHVCLDEAMKAPPCTCGDSAYRGHLRSCRHIRAVMVSLYRWAEASPQGVEGWSGLFLRLGITALHAGSRAPVEAQGSLMEVAA